MRSDFSLYTPSSFKQVMVLLSKKFLLFLLDLNMVVEHTYMYIHSRGYLIIVLHYSFIQYQNGVRLIHHISSYTSTKSQ